MTKIKVEKENYEKEKSLAVPDHMSHNLQIRKLIEVKVEKQNSRITNHAIQPL